MKIQDSLQTLELANAASMEQKASLSGENLKDESKIGELAEQFESIFLEIVLKSFFRSLCLN